MPLGTTRARGSKPGPKGKLEDHEQEDQELKAFENAMKTMPPAPATLADVGKAKWLEYGSILVARGLMLADFLPSLEILCTLHDTEKALEKMLGPPGSPSFGTILGPRGVLKMHPAIATRNLTLHQIRTMQTDFGLTPSSYRNTKGVGLPLTGGKASVRRRGS